MPVAVPVYNNLINVIKSLPESYTAQVLDYASYLKEKADRQAVETHPCPICAENIDPKTGNPRYNAETVAAIEEGRAMMRGEIPAKWYDNFDDFLADLNSDDDDEENN